MARSAGPVSRPVRLHLLGVGAMNSPRYRPAGLLVVWRGHRVMLDGGGSAVPVDPVHAWLVCDLRAELIADIRRQARAVANPPPAVGAWDADGLHIRPLPVVHTSHETFGYLIDAGGRQIVWAPEFLRFPQWAAGADLMFADAAGWQRPIRFAGGVGGHAAVIDTAEHARQAGVRRLVFAHIGRPSIRARDAGLKPPFGEWGVQGRVYRLTVAGVSAIAGFQATGNAAAARRGSQRASLPSTWSASTAPTRVPVPPSTSSNSAGWPCGSW